jgi:hypothetical protein
MAYNYLTLVNDVNRKVNEVELTSSDFASATGFYGTAKDAVNYAINEINQHQFEWPFNASEKTETLTPGTVLYSFPSTAKRVDFDSFRIKGDASLGNDTERLEYLTYEEYLDRFSDHLYNSNTGIREVPKYVSQNNAGEILIAPSPDKAYEMVYDYFTLPVDLVAYDDVPTVPEHFRNIIVEGAMYYVHMFRQDGESAALAMRRFTDGINNMRTIFTNRTQYVRDTRIRRNL